MTTETIADTPISENKTPPGNAPSLSSGRGGLLFFLVTLLLIAIRFASERTLMGEFGSDPQMGIWWFFLYAQLLFWFATGCVATQLQIWCWNRPWLFRVTLTLWLGWMIAIGWSSYLPQRYRVALADANSPMTSATRLRQLTHFPGMQGGYELDNRIAANPNTDPETLRSLYFRRNLGTLMVLARNPKTPEDVLQEMVAHDLTETLIRRSLKTNPNLPLELRKKIEAAEKMPK